MAEEADTLEQKEPTRRQLVLLAIDLELQRAYKKHGKAPWGRHEFYGIAKEEFDELWEAIKLDQEDPYVIAEAVEVAAMMIRYLETNDRYRGDLDAGLLSVIHTKRLRLAHTKPAPGVEGIQATAGLVVPLHEHHKTLRLLEQYQAIAKKALDRTDGSGNIGWQDAVTISRTILNLFQKER